MSLTGKRRKLSVEHLIVKYLQRDLTLDEQHELSKWLQSDERNAETLKQIHTYWHYHKDSLQEEEQEVRSRLHNRIQAELTSQSQKRKKTSWKLVYRIAASVVVVCSLLFGFYQYKSGTEIENKQAAARLIEKVSLPGQKITTLLPDGTRVKLNADSKLIVPSLFQGKTREVTLIGEAFFVVKHDPEHPFIIKTGQVDVQVLGTSFNVQAYDDGASPQVAVKTGKVAVKSHDFEDEVQLFPGEMARMERKDLIKVPIPESHDPFAWTDQMLVFDNESVSEVLRKISRWYGVKINVKSNITLGKRYTANYQNPTLTEVMDILAFVYDFKYKYDDDKKIIVIQ